MGGRIAALVVKELLAILRDPKGRLVLIAPPLIQLLIFSYAATLEVKNVEIAILNQDAGRWSAELIQRIDGSPTFTRLVYLHGPEALEEAIDRGRVIAAIRIGPDFSRDIEAGRPATVQAILDGRRSNAAQIVAGYIGRIVDGMSPAPGPRPSIEARNWFNPNLDFIWYTVPSLVAIISLLIGLIVTALSVARERELGTFDQLMVSPLRTHEILVGKTVPPLLIGLVHSTVFILAAILVFDVPLRGSVLLLYASLVFYLAATIGVGLFISALSATQQQAILGAFLFASPAILLSGFATPVDNMPEWLQAVTIVNPLRHFLTIVQGIFLKDLPAEQVIAGTIPLALIALCTLTAAAWLFRRRME
ncbi:ABC transporter permease [Inquilinus sp. CAU 1745]|uniref:ABC transporter permease n=1 Tax=Inquilinus sp. CAU 1745 TaxID=3140369 RepID=UPI00325A584B